MAWKAGPVIREPCRALPRKSAEYDFFPEAGREKTLCKAAATREIEAKRNRGRLQSPDFHFDSCRQAQAGADGQSPQNRFPLKKNKMTPKDSNPLSFQDSHDQSREDIFGPLQSLIVWWCGVWTPHARASGYHPLERGHMGLRFLSASWKVTFTVFQAHSIREPSSLILSKIQLVSGKVTLFLSPSCEPPTFLAPQRLVP